MKKNFLFAAALMLFAMAISASAQKATDFSGSWNLDLTKSKITGIESQTLVVTQTETDLKVETTTKRAAPPAGAPAGGPPPGGGGRMGGGGGGDTPVSYALNGTAVKSEISNPMGSMPVSTTAKLDGGKLEITRVITTPRGEMTSGEKWWLNCEGMLSIESYRPNRDGGSDTVTRVFVKK